MADCHVYSQLLILRVTDFLVTECDQPKHRWFLVYAIRVYQTKSATQINTCSCTTYVSLCRYFYQYSLITTSPYSTRINNSKTSNCCLFRSPWWCRTGSFWELVMRLYKTGYALKMRQTCMMQINPPKLSFSFFHLLWKYWSPQQQPLTLAHVGSISARSPGPTGHEVINPITLTNRLLNNWFCIYTMWHEIFAGVNSCGLAIFFVIWGN